MKKTLSIKKAKESVSKSTKRGTSSSGRELADALRKVALSPEDAKAWHEDLINARKMLIPPVDKWR